MLQITARVNRESIFQRYDNPPSVPQIFEKDRFENRFNRSSRDKPRICTVSLAWREIKAFVSTIEVLQYEQKAVTRAILSSRQREWIPVGAVCFERGGTRAKIVSKRFINSQRVH